jgi:hypothetical protein
LGHYRCCVVGNANACLYHSDSSWYTRFVFFFYYYFLAVDGLPTIVVLVVVLVLVVLISVDDAVICQ